MSLVGHGSSEWFERIWVRNIGNFDYPALPVYFGKEKLTAVGPYYLVSASGEVSDPTQGVIGNLSGTQYLEKENSVINPFRGHKYVSTKTIQDNVMGQNSDAIMFVIDYNITDEMSLECHYC